MVIHRLSVLLFSLGLPACGTINALQSATNHSGYATVTQRETGRTRGPAEYHQYNQIIQRVGPEGLDIHFSQRDLCPVQVSHRAKQRARKIGSPTFEFSGNPDRDIFWGMAADLAVGGLILGASSTHAHYDPDVTPNQWALKRSQLRGMTAGMVGVDLAAYVYSVKRRTRIHTWFTQETVECKTSYPLDARAQVSVVLDSGKPQPLLFSAPSQVRVSAQALGWTLLSRGRSAGNESIKMKTTVLEHAEGADIGGSATFAKTISAVDVARRSDAWRCAALGKDTGAQRLESWSIDNLRALDDAMKRINCGKAEVVRTRICTASKDSAPRFSIKMLPKDHEAISTFLARCNDHDRWRGVLNAHMTRAFQASQVQTIRDLATQYQPQLGEAWVKPWQKKADQLVTKSMATILTSKNSSGVLKAHALLVGQVSFLSKGTLAKERKRLQGAARSVVASLVTGEQFSNASQFVNSIRQGVGDSWADKQHRYIAAAVTKREARQAAAVKWCDNSRYRILKQILPYKECMNSMDSGAEMQRRLSFDQELYVQHILVGSKACVGRVGMSSTVSQFARDCSCRDVSNFSIRDRARETREPCEDEQEELSLRELERERESSGTNRERTCNRRTSAVHARQWAWRDCMVTNDASSPMQRWYASDSALYQKEMERAGQSCLDKVGARRPLKRLQTDGCSCRVVGNFTYEDRNGNEHTPCDWAL